MDCSCEYITVIAFSSGCADLFDHSCTAAIRTTTAFEVLGMFVVEGAQPRLETDRDFTDPLRSCASGPRLLPLVARTGRAMHALCNLGSLCVYRYWFRCKGNTRKSQITS